MARTLYIIDDKVIRGLGERILKAMQKELNDIFSFVTNFSITMVTPTKLPATIDFTDSILIVVPHDDDVAPTKSTAEQQQVRSIKASILQRHLNIQLAQVTRTAQQPDLGGVGWQGKEILQNAIVCKTGGIASCQYVKEAVLKQFAPDQLSLDDAKQRRDKAKIIAATAHGDEKFKKEQRADEYYAKVEEHWKLTNAAFASWPKDMQEAFGNGLARLIAHEARHQYVVEHFSAGGLGGESAELFGVPSSERFLKDDQTDINASLTQFESDQSKATIHLETFPNGQPFAIYITRSSSVA